MMESLRLWNTCALSVYNRDKIVGDGLFAFLRFSRKGRWRRAAVALELPAQVRLVCVAQVRSQASEVDIGVSP